MALLHGRAGRFIPAKNGGLRPGAGVYVTDQLAKAMHYAQGKPHGGCVLQLEVDLGDCLHLDGGNLGMRRTWHGEYDSAHAAEGVLGSGSKEEYCIKDPRMVKKLVHVTLVDAGKAKAAGFKTATDAAGPPGHCAYWTVWVSWLQQAPGAEAAADWQVRKTPSWPRSLANCSLF